MGRVEFCQYETFYTCSLLDLPNDIGTTSGGVSKGAMRMGTKRYLAPELLDETFNPDMVCCGEGKREVISSAPAVRQLHAR